VAQGGSTLTPTSASATLVCTVLKNKLKSLSLIEEYQVTEPEKRIEMCKFLLFAKKKSREEPQEGTYGFLAKDLPSQAVFSEVLGMINRSDEDDYLL
jgi:hypothetical protein